MNWPSTVCNTRAPFIPAYISEPAITAAGGMHYHHYYITGHAIDRYIERIGGDVGSLIADLDRAWVFNIHQRHLPRKHCVTVARHERSGGYVLRSGNVLFMIRPDDFRHVIVTTLSLY